MNQTDLSAINTLPRPRAIRQGDDFDRGVAVAHVIGKCSVGTLLRWAPPPAGTRYDADQVTVGQCEGRSLTEALTDPTVAVVNLDVVRRAALASAHTPGRRVMSTHGDGKERLVGQHSILAPQTVATAVATGTRAGLNVEAESLDAD